MKPGQPTQNTPNQTQFSKTISHDQSRIETARHMAKLNTAARAQALQAGRTLQNQGVQQAPAQRQQQYVRAPQHLPQQRQTPSKSL